MREEPRTFPAGWKGRGKGGEEGEEEKEGMGEREGGEGGGGKEEREEREGRRGREVAWQQCRLRDVIIAHVLSADAQIYYTSECKSLWGEPE